MARAKASTATTDDTVHECCVSFAFSDPDRGDVPRVVKTGEKVRATDSAYKVAAQYFCEAGTPHAERPKITDFIPEGGGQTIHKPQPSGWRMAVEGHGKPWDQQP